jgi:hypothetical protein
MTELIIDLRFLAESQPSLCIPRVFNNISEHKIREIFDELCLGKISRIDIKVRKNEKGESFKRLYIHFDKWFWNENAQAARRKLISGKEIKIVYDNPWFWKVSASKWEDPTGNSHEKGSPPQRSRVHIELDDSPRVTHEFVRDKKEQDVRKIIDNHNNNSRHDETREHQRPENKRPEDKRPEDKRPENKRPENKRPENKRPEERHHYERNPTRDIKTHNNTHPIPILRRKVEKAKIQMSQQNIVEVHNTSHESLETIRDDDNPDELTPLHIVNVDYGEYLIPIIKSRKPKLRKPKIIPDTRLLSLVTVSLEEGEIVENQCEKYKYSGISDADKKECEDLYGDL